MSGEDQIKTDQTLAQQLAESEQAMYEQSQQQIQDIEAEVSIILSFQKYKSFMKMFLGSRNSTSCWTQRNH